MKRFIIIIYIIVVSIVVFNLTAKPLKKKTKCVSHRLNYNISLDLLCITDTTFFNQLYNEINRYKDNSSLYYHIEIRDTDYVALDSFYVDSNIPKNKGIEILVSSKRYPIASSLVDFNGLKFVSNGWMEAYNIAKCSKNCIKITKNISCDFMEAVYDYNEFWKFIYYNQELKLVYYANYPLNYYIDWRSNLIHSEDFLEIKLFEFFE